MTGDALVAMTADRDRMRADLIDARRTNDRHCTERDEALQVLGRLVHAIDTSPDICDDSHFERCLQAAQALVNGVHIAPAPKARSGVEYHAPPRTPTPEEAKAIEEMRAKLATSEAQSANSRARTVMEKLNGWGPELIAEYCDAQYEHDVNVIREALELVPGDAQRYAATDEAARSVYLDTWIREGTKGRSDVTVLHVEDMIIVRFTGEMPIISGRRSEAAQPVGDAMRRTAGSDQAALADARLKAAVDAAAPADIWKTKYTACHAELNAVHIALRGVTNVSAPDECSAPELAVAAASALLRFRAALEDLAPAIRSAREALDSPAPKAGSGEGPCISRARTVISTSTT